MTHPYNELYVDDAMENLGGMVAYAVTDCGYEPDGFFSWFISSGLAELFGKGNPHYVGGMSGIELAQQVVYAATGAYPQAQPTHQIGQVYWAGWILAYYQWVTGLSFHYIAENGLPLSKIISLYRLHEADPSKFVETANAIMGATKQAIQDHKYDEQDALEHPTLDDTEHLLAEADKAAAATDARYTGDELFGRVRKRMENV